MSCAVNCAGDCGCTTRGTPFPESLLRPEFFCGQLLTDADMTALTAWVRARLRLTAERTGWGVVCGLAVVSDVQRPSRVTVRPGVAVSPCGQDILVPADALVDLSGAVPALGVPCDRPAQQQKEQTKPSADCVVDVSVRYREEGRLPVLGVGRGDCVPPSSCMDSRMNESYKLVAEAVVDPGSKPDGGWTEWKDGYARAVALLERTREIDLRRDPQAAAEWLKDRWREAVRTRFPQLGQRIDDWRRSEDHSDARFAELLYWVTQDRVLGYLETPCLPACPSTAGGCGCGSSAPAVPLARVWLHNDDGEWAVTAVDDQPPFRRLLSIERPRPPEGGGVNLGHVIWRDKKDAARLVRRAGLAVRRMDEWRLADVAAVQALLSEPPATAADAVILRYVTVPDWVGIGGYRTVGFGTDLGMTALEQADDVTAALRPRYRESQVLTLADLTDEQAARIQAARRHLLTQHSWGVTGGFRVTATPGGAGVEVAPGDAVDGFGRRPAAAGAVDPAVERPRSRGRRPRPVVVCHRDPRYRAHLRGNGGGVDAD